MPAFASHAMLPSVNVVVYSRGAIERIAPFDEAHIIVSITSAPEDRAQLRENPQCIGVLRLSFADADEAHTTSLTLFDRDHAIAIRDFVRAHVARVEWIVVHCDAGLSRSPAVAAAIVRAFGGDDSPWFKRYRPNARVYRLLLEAFVELHDAPA